MASQLSRGRFQSPMTLMARDEFKCSCQPLRIARELHGRGIGKQLVEVDT